MQAAGCAKSIDLSALVLPLVCSQARVAAFHLNISRTTLLPEVVTFWWCQLKLQPQDLNSLR